MGQVRILQITDNLNRGGIETFIMNVYRSIDRGKIQFDFLISEPSKCDYEDEIIALGGKIFRIPPKSMGIRKFVKSSNSFLKQNTEYRVVHIHSSSLISSLLWLLTHFRKTQTKIIHSHNTEATQDLKGMMRKIGQFILRKQYSYLFGCSTEAGRWMFGDKTLNSPKYRFIKNGINTSAFFYDESLRTRKRKEMGLEGKKVIGHIGRFNTQKNHVFIFDVFEKIHQKNPTSVLLLIGQGELWDKMKEKAIKLGLESDILFLGVRHDINELLNAMDVFFLPSLYEGLPVVGIESQATGIPLVVSTEITKEIDISNNVTFESLEKNAEEWASLLLNIKDNNRNTVMDNIKNNGYDIQDTVNILSLIYLAKNKEGQHG